MQAPACKSVCACDWLHLWASLCVWVQRVCPCHVSPFPSHMARLFLWMGQTIHFQAGGQLWAWPVVAPGSWPCDASEAWFARPPGTAPTLSSGPCAEHTIGAEYSCYNQCLLSVLLTRSAHRHHHTTFPGSRKGRCLEMVGLNELNSPVSARWLPAWKSHCLQDQWHNLVS